MPRPTRRAPGHRPISNVSRPAPRSSTPLSGRLRCAGAATAADFCECSLSGSWRTVPRLLPSTRRPTIAARLCPCRFPGRRPHPGGPGGRCPDAVPAYGLTFPLLYARPNSVRCASVAYAQGIANRRGDRPPALRPDPTLPGARAGRLAESRANHSRPGVPPHLAAEERGARRVPSPAPNRVAAGGAVAATVAPRRPGWASGILAGIA